MPKRRNPFGDFSPLQLKTHVGQKELNTGVDGELHLKTVYEKTKQKLFQAAQKNMNGGILTDANDNQVVFPCSFPVPLNMPQLSAGQLLLDQSGQLTAPLKDVEMDTAPSGTFGYSFRNECSPPQNDQEMPSSNQMRLDFSGRLAAPVMSMSGDMDTLPNLQKTWNSFAGKGKQPMNNRGPQEKSKCNFCEKWMTSDAAQQCSRCNEDFCNICSTVNYDTCSETIFCLNCNS